MNGKAIGTSRHFCRSLLLASAVLLIGICGLVPVGPAGAEERSVRIGVYENAPKIFISETGRPGGIFIDVIESIARSEGWNLEYVRGTWAEGLDRLQKNEIDLMPDVAYSPERAQLFSFHKTPVLSSWSQVYVLKDSRIQSVLDLEGKRVAVLADSVQQKTFSRITGGFGLNITLITVPDYKTMFEMAGERKIDAVITNHFFGQKYARKAGLQESAIIFDPIDLFFAAPKNGYKVLLNAIDARLVEMKQDPQSVYYASMKKWTSEEVRFRIPQWILVIGIILGILLTAIIVGSAFLKHQVTLRTKELLAAESELLASNRALRTLSECNQALVHATDEQSLLEAVCRIIVDVGGYRMVWVGYKENDEAKTVRPVAQAGYGEDYRKELNITWADDERGRGPTGTAVRTGRPVTARYIMTDPNYEPWRSAALNHGYASSLALPLIVAGETIGALNVYSAQPDGFDNEETVMLTELAGDLAYGIGTHRTRAEAKLAAQHVRYLSQYANDFIILLDESFHFLEVNDRVVDGYGYTREELNHMHATQLRSNETRGDFEKQSENARALGSTLYETVHRRRDGTTFPVEINLRAIETGGKKFYQAVIRDITERKRIEEKLLASERKYRELVMLANSIILRWSPDGKIKFLNEFGQRFFGYTQEEIVGRHVIDTIVPTNESTGRDLRPLMDAVCADPKSFERNVNENVRRNGERVWIDWTNKVILDPQGKILEILSIGSDITERMKAEEEIRKLNEDLKRHAEFLEHRVMERTAELVIAKERAESADRVKSAFLASMSHELRTPLNSIIGFTGIILQELAGPLNPEQTKQMKMVQISSRHLLSLINDILDISKIEAGQLQLKNETFSPRASMEKVVSLVSHSAEQKNLELRLSFPDPSETVTTDVRRLEQILLNLLNNAIKFTEKGSVTLRSRMENEHLMFSVTDTGIGMRSEDISGLFQPFHQIDTGLTRKYEGTGLGLSICKKLLDMMGGGISVESRVGAGSTFTVRIPKTTEVHHG